VSTRAQLLATVATDFPTNGVELITAADARHSLDDMINSSWIPSTDGTPLVSPMSAAGDLIYGGVAGAATRLAPGTANQVLHSGTTPTWSAVSLTADVSGILPAANGGSANAFFAVTGPAASVKTFTFPNASATVLTDNAAVTVAQGGTGRATSTTAYGLLAAGTTATGAQQTLAAGATTEILVGGGAAALPVWTTATGTGAPVCAGSPAFSGTPTFADTGFTIGAATPATIAGSAGSLTFTAAGTNQNIWFAPSGTGINSSSKSWTIGTGSDSTAERVAYTILNSGYSAPSSVNALANGDKFVYYNQTGGKFAIGLDTSFGFWFQATGATPHFKWYTGAAAGTQYMTLANSGHLLLGGLTTDGTGILQFPAATANTGGLNFGTEIYFFRTGTNTAQISASSGLTLTGSITTSAPNAGTAGAWKFGIRVAATVVFDTTQYIQLDVGGTLYKLALAI
jgi:hypothetical protein